jgi:NADH:ubiquinone oxidoreductase subunit 2 (subunit N)
MSQKRKFISDYVADHDAAEHSELLKVFRLELLAHYELPKYLPHQILTLMMALNDQDERSERSRETKHAFALSVTGVMVVMAVWNLMLSFY